LITEAQT